MTTPIDTFQNQVAANFRELILATAYLKIGSGHLSTVPKTASVALTLAPDITTEPMYLRELLPHSPAVVEGVAELFQAKIVAAWADLLNALFEHFVTTHLNGTKRYPELKKRTARIDFSLEGDIILQVRETILAEFAFERYAERVKVINRILNPNGAHQDELAIARKHVLIRNSIQHHGGNVYEDLLKELGCRELCVLDQNGGEKRLNLLDQIPLSVPELDSLKGALFRLTNAWKPNYV